MPEPRHDAGAERFGWNACNAQPGKTRDGQWLVGMGVAAAFRNNLVMKSAARIRLDRNGVVTKIWWSTNDPVSSSIMTWLGMKSSSTPMISNVVADESQGRLRTWHLRSGGGDRQCDIPRYWRTRARLPITLDKLLPKMAAVS